MLGAFNSLMQIFRHQFIDVIWCNLYKRSNLRQQQPPKVQGSKKYKASNNGECVLQDSFEFICDPGLKHILLMFDASCMFQSCDQKGNALSVHRFLLLMKPYVQMKQLHQ